MYYEINVALNGQHFFATDKRSITTSWKMKEIYELFKEKFPKEEGYKIEVTYWETVGKRVDIDSIIKEG